jgi:hypothetical protein
MDDDTTSTEPDGIRANNRWASEGSVSEPPTPPMPPSAPRRAITVRAAASAASHPSLHPPDRLPTRPPGSPASTHRVAARLNNVGSERTKVEVSRSGSRQRPHGSTTTASAPPATAEDRKPLTTFDTHGSPRRSTVSGTWPRAKRPDRRMASAAPMTPGRSRRAPERGSASTGHPRESDSASTASGSPHPAPATISPRRARSNVPDWKRSLNAPSGGGTRPWTTWCHGRPLGRPGLTPPPAAGSPRSGSRKGRLRWTGPGPPAPEVASATDRAASDRHDERAARSGTP